MSSEDLPGRVLVCYRSYRKGGCGRRFAQMIRALAEAGVEVHCACESPFPVEHEKVAYHLLRNPFGNGDSLPAWAAFLALTPGRLARLAGQLKPEAVLVFSGLYGWLARRAAQTTGIPLAVFCRLRPGARPRLVERALTRKGFHAADEVIVQTEATRVQMCKWADVPEDRMSLLPNDVPLLDVEHEERRAARERLLELSGFPAESFLAVFAGRLATVKGIETLLASMRHSREERVKLVLLGDGPQRVQYEALARRTALSAKVRFCGWQEESQRLVAGADVAVSSALIEGAPNALLEALGAGLPCIAGDIPEVREILQYDELLFPVTDSGELARRIDRAASDSAYLEKLGSLCAERAAAYTFDWDARLVEIVARIYQRTRK